MRLLASHGGERLGQHPLEQRQRDDTPFVVAHRGQVPHFDDREQPLVLRVVVGDTAEHVDVLTGGQPFHREVAEAP